MLRHTALEDRSISQLAVNRLAGANLRALLMGVTAETFAKCFVNRH
jgi:hypothetical protein